MFIYDACCNANDANAQVETDTCHVSVLIKHQPWQTSTI